MQLLSLNENESTSASYCPPLVCCMQLQSIPQDAYIKRKRWRRKSHIGRYRTKQREGKMLAAGLISAVMLPWLMSLIKNSLERLCTAAKRGKGGGYEQQTQRWDAVPALMAFAIGSFVRSYFQKPKTENSRPLIQQSHWCCKHPAFCVSCLYGCTVPLTS